LPPITSSHMRLAVPAATGAAARIAAAMYNQRRRTTRNIYASIWAFVITTCYWQARCHFERRDALQRTLLGSFSINELGTCFTEDEAAGPTCRDRSCYESVITTHCV
jgi:hypothetical protein